MALDKHLVAKLYPIANGKNIICWKDYRITVLQDRLFRVEKSKNQIYYYCSSYIREKNCLIYSINKKKLEQMVKDEIIKKINIEHLDTKTLNELIDMIYIIDKNNIKIEFKNI